MQTEEISSSFIEQLHWSGNADSLAPSGAVKTGNLRVAKLRQREPVGLGDRARGLGAAGALRWKGSVLGARNVRSPGEARSSVQCWGVREDVLF